MGHTGLPSGEIVNSQIEVDAQASGLVSVRVAGQILHQICQGEFPVGSRLPSEQQLARFYEVSRPSIREALSALQFAGCIESRQGFGTLVVSQQTLAGPREPWIDSAKVSPNAIDLLEARLALEPEAIRMAAKGSDHRGLKEARTLLNGMWLALESPGTVGASTDLNLHIAFVRLCPNPLVRDAALSLLQHTLTSPGTSGRQAAWGDSRILEAWAIQHEAILSCIATGDGHHAAKAARHHLISVVQQAISAAGLTPEEVKRAKSMLSNISPEDPPK